MPLFNRFGLSLVIVATALFVSSVRAQDFTAGVVLDPSDGTAIYDFTFSGPPGNRAIIASGLLQDPLFLNPFSLTVGIGGNIFVGAEDALGNDILQVVIRNSGNVFDVSTPGAGAGPLFDNLRDLATYWDGSVIGVDSGLDAVFRIDPPTGDRTIISGDPGGADVGVGPVMVQPRSVTTDAQGMIWVGDNTRNALFLINPINGRRTIVSGDPTGKDEGSGPAFGTLRDIALHPSGDILVADVSNAAILRVDPVTGDRTILSDNGTPDGVNPFSQITGAFARPNGQVFVGDNGYSPPAILGVDNTTGQRVIVSDEPPNGNGPPFGGIGDIALDGVLPPPQTTLHFHPNFGGPGSAVFANVSITVDQDVSGVQFDIQPVVNGSPSNMAVFSDLITDVEHLGFQTSFSDMGNGITRVLMLSFSGGVLQPGEHTVLELLYLIDNSAPNGAVIDLEITNLLVTDNSPNVDPIPADLWRGTFTVGAPGDLSFDGQVNLIDILKIIKTLLGIIPVPAVDSFDYFVTDVNGDGSIDIADAVMAINLFLNAPLSKDLSDSPSQPILANVGEIQMLEDGRTVISLELEADGTIAGLQAALSFDPSKVSLGQPFLADRMSGFTLLSRIDGDALNVIAYSVTGDAVPAGRGAAIFIPVSLIDRNASLDISLTQVTASDRYAHLVATEIGINRARNGSLPSSFGLQGSAPNPFNPSTSIAYEVPKQAHIQLVVYNALGQEVVRLVDGMKAAGRYSVTWNARNAQGASVASGIYLYRLTSSTGFSASKRMTLLK